MMKNGNFFKIGIYIFIILNSSIGLSQTVSISIGGGLSDAFGYKFNTKPVFTFPYIDLSLNINISKNDRHWLTLSEGYRQKGVQYSYNETTVKHKRGYLYYGLSYKYSIYLSENSNERSLISLGVYDGALFLGSKSVVNGNNISSFSYGRKGFRNWTVYLGTESMYGNFGYSIKIFGDANSYNPSSFNNDPKIYFGGIELSLNYYFE